MAHQQRLHHQRESLGIQQRQRHLLPADSDSGGGNGGGEQQSPIPGEKRKFRDLDFDSDEDDFAGFEDEPVSGGNENGAINSTYLAAVTESPTTAARKDSWEIDSGATEEPSAIAAATEAMGTVPKQEDTESSSNGDASKSAAVKRKVTVGTNVQDEAFRIPFKYGWRRELVYRANLDGQSKDKGEVYYITPAGKKLRTRNDIVASLHDGLTMDNFTFVKDPVGGKPDEEIIRSAKSYGSTPRRSTISVPQHQPSILDAQGDLGKRVPKPKMPKGASPPPPPSAYPRPSPNQTRTSPSSRGAGSQQTSPKNSIAGGGVGGTVPASRNTPSAAVKGNESAAVSARWLKQKKVDSCTIQCLPAMGMIPQLQCAVCHCMFHPECVTATLAEVRLRRFTCKGCLEDALMLGMAEKEAMKAPSPVAPPNGGSQPLSLATSNGTSIPPHVVHEKPKRSTAKGGAAAAAVRALQQSNAKEIPPQDVIVVGNHQFIVVPKGRVAAAKSKKSAAKGGTTITTSNKDTVPIQRSLSTAKSSLHTSLSSPSEENPRKSSTGSGSSGRNNNSNRRISADTSGTMPAKVNDVLAPVSVPRMSSLAVGPEQNNVFASSFFSNVSIGYNVLLQTFQYLKVQELLRASCVCRMWNHVANHPRFWKTVRMKNSLVNDWSGLANTLRNNGTKHLDLRKMLISGNGDAMWQSFTTYIGRAYQLERIDLCRCSSTVVSSLLQSNGQLRVVNALAIKNDPIDFYGFEAGRNLEELRLKSSTAISIDGDLSPLGACSNLKYLSLTSMQKLGATSVSAIGTLSLLETLELGECTELGDTLAHLLPGLENLQRLRLEKGQENFNLFATLNAIATMSQLAQLELINCDVKMGFDAHIEQCRYLRKLLLIPTYVSQSAATNHMVLSGVGKLTASLESFVWTVTVELLRVTELYIDQCDTQNRDDKNNPGESIPILKPVPGADDGTIAASVGGTSTSSDTPAQVEIVPLTTVESILMRALPRTKIKIMKIPFANTWKQTMTELP